MHSIEKFQTKNVNNFYLDYFDLFNRNRLSGFYRADSIDRFDYGLSFLKRSNITKIFSKIGLAQSYHFDNHKFLPKNSGINDKFSDFLANLELSPTDSLNLSLYLSLDKDNFSIKTPIQHFCLISKHLLKSQKH